MLVRLKEKGFLMSIPDRVLVDLAQYKTLIAEVPNFEESKRTCVVLHHMQNDENEKLLFDMKRFTIDKESFAALPEAENIDVPEMEHYVVDDLVSLEMLMRLWVPNLDEMVRPSIYGLKSLYSPVVKPRIKIRTKPGAVV